MAEMDAAAQDKGTPVRTGQDYLPLIRSLENSKDDAVSRAGAIGRYQVMPGTARQYGFDPKKLTDPAYNEQVAATVLNDLHRRFNGDPEAMMVGYNAGPTVASRWVASGKTAYIPRETFAYLNRGQKYLRINGLPAPQPKEPSEGAPAPATAQADQPPGMQKIQQWQAAGFSNDEILQQMEDKSKEFLKAGFTAKDITDYWGQSPPDPKQIDALAHHTFSNSVTPDDAPTIARNPLDTLAAGWGMSVSGLAIKGGMPSTVLPEDATGLQKGLFAGAQAVGDLPAMLAGGVGGLLAGAEAGPVGSLAAGGAGAFGLPVALRETMMDYYRRGEMHSASDFIRQATQSVYNTTSAMLTGAISTVTGGTAAGAVKPLLGPAVAKGTDLLTQAMVSTVVSSAFAHKTPDAGDFTTSAVLALTFAGAQKLVPGGKPTPAAVKVGKTLEDIYRETGTPPWTVVQQAATDPVVRQEILAEDPSGQPVFPKLRLGAEDEPPPFKQNEVTLHETPQTEAEGGGAGKPPGEDITPPEPGVPEARPQTEDELNKVASTFLGEEGKQDSLFNSSTLYRQFVSIFGNAREIDEWLAKEHGFDRDRQFGIEDGFRQTLASDERARHFIYRGGVDPITKTLRSDVPAYLDAVKAAQEDGGDFGGFINYVVVARALKREQDGFATGHPLAQPEMQRLLDLGRSKYGRAVDSLQKTRDGGLQYGRDTGILNDKRIAAMKEADPVYVPFRRASGDDTPIPRPTRGYNFQVSDPVRRYVGSDAKIIEPFFAAVDDTRQIIRMGDRNLAIAPVIELAERGNIREMLGLNRIDFPPEMKASMAEPDLGEQVTDAMKEAYAPFLAQRAFRKSFKANDDRFLYFRDGQAELWQARDPLFAAMMRGADSPGEANAAMKIMENVAKMQRLGIVGDPTFAERVAIKHGITAYIADRTHPLPFYTWMRGAMDVFGQSDRYWDFVAKGGAVEALADLNHDALERDINGVFEQTGTWDKMWNTVRHPIEALRIVESLATKVGNANRLGYVKNARDLGYDPIKAETMGRKAMLDFSERGTLQMMQWWSRLVPFLRPRILGLKQYGESFKERPGETLAYSFAAIVAPKVLLYGLNWMQDEYGDGPEDQKYRNLPRWQKDSMYVLPAVGGVRLRLPLPFVVGPLFGGMTDRFLDHFVQDDPTAFKQWWSLLAAEFMPNVIPAVALPILEASTNHQFFSGHALVPDSLKEASGEMQYVENTTETAKALSRVVGSLGGNVSPIVLENYLRGYFPMGLTALRALDAPFKTVGKPWEMADNPFVGSFFVRHPGSSAAPIQSFYDESESFKQGAADRRLALKRLAAGNPSAEAELNRALDEDQGQLDQIGEAIHMNQALVQAIYNDTSMTNDEKRQYTDDIYGNMIAIAKAGLDVIKSLKDARR